MKTEKKAFDCVEMKRAGSLRIYEETKNLSLEEKREYWRKATEETLAAQQEVRRKLQLCSRD